MADYSKMSDKELLLNDPPESGKITELISRYMKTVFAGARKYSGSADYEELVSDGMDGLLAAIRSYDPDKGEFSSFVSVCVENRLRNTAKKALRRSSKIADTEPVELEDIADPSPTPEEVVIARENSEAMLRNMENALTLLELSCVKCAAMGLSYKETAAYLNIDIKSVDNALRRARSKLKELYK